LGQPTPADLTWSGSKVTGRLPRGGTHRYGAGVEPPAITVPCLSGVPTDQVALDDRSWVGVARGWLGGADDVYAALVERAPWQQGRIFRYERWIDEPRLSSWARPGTDLHPILTEVHRAVQRQCKVRFEGFALAWYRDGRDSVAFHRDRELRWLDDTVIAVLTLGAQRPFLLRPRRARFDPDDHSGPVVDLSPAGGDLLIMGGRCQADWEHSVPKVAHRIGGRVSLQWRWTSRRGRPERGPGYRAPRHYTG
jgi:alkylated DNA repair dioxygenase AlkB